MLTSAGRIVGSVQIYAARPQKASQLSHPQTLWRRGRLKRSLKQLSGFPRGQTRADLRAAGVKTRAEARVNQQTVDNTASAAAAQWL